MRHSLFLAMAATLLLFVPAFVGAQYSTSAPTGPVQSVATRPRLRFESAPKITDEVAIAGDQHVILRSGENIPMRLPRRPMITVDIDSHINTEAIKKGVTFTRILEFREALNTEFKSAYADKGTQLETVFSGHSSGFKNRAHLLISPVQFEIEVGPTDYKIIDKLDDVYIALKPGKWRFEVHSVLTHIVSPDGEMWTASADSETGDIVGKGYGGGRRDPFNADPLIPICSIPVLGAFCPIIELKSLFERLRRRPNIIVPSQSTAYFRVHKLTGTYLGPPVPTGPATIVR